jgi:hypothetical protein
MPFIFRTMKSVRPRAASAGKAASNWQSAKDGGLLQKLQKGLQPESSQSSALGIQPELFKLLSPI